MNIGKKKKLLYCLIFLMYKKVLFFVIGLIFSNGYSFNKIERLVYCVKFDKDLFLDLCLRNWKKNYLYGFFMLVGMGYNLKF